MSLLSSTVLLIRSYYSYYNPLLPLSQYWLHEFSVTVHQCDLFLFATQISLPYLISSYIDSFFPFCKTETKYSLLVTFCKNKQKVINKNFFSLYTLHSETNMIFITTTFIWPSFSVNWTGVNNKGQASVKDLYFYPKPFTTNKIMRYYRRFLLEYYLWPLLCRQ